MSCDKTFKNSASLASHKHRYHPYLPRKSAKRLNELSFVNPQISDNPSLGNISDSALENKIADNKRDRQSLSNLVKRVEELESKFHLQCSCVDRNFQTDLNKGNITLSKNQMQDVVQRDKVSDSDTDSLTSAEDLIDEMLEVRDLFIVGNFESLNANIKSLKRAITLMLKANIGSEILSSEELSLLEDISQYANPSAKMLLKNNFSRLEIMFTKLKPVFD